MFKKVKRKTNNDNNSKKCFWFFSVLIIFSLFSYGYLVRSTIINIVERKNMESKFFALNSEIIDLESDYIKTKSSITQELAYNLGFIFSNDKKFVSKNNDFTLSLITSEF